MHNTLQIYYKFTTWTRTQANAKSVFSGRALRLHVTIETSFGWPLGRPLGLTSPKAGRFTSRAMHPQDRARARSASGSSLTLGPARPGAGGRREAAAPGGA